MKYKSRITYQFLFIAGVVVLINLLSTRFFLRFDLTDDNRYTLSQATKDILRNLDEPVTINAYFTADLPPQYLATRRQFTELLVEYSQVSRGMVVFETIDPTDEESEMQAMRAGIQPVIVNIRERDQVKQQKAFMGAEVRMGERKEVIPFIQPDAAMEYALSSSIKKLTITHKPLVGFVQGHGQPPISAMRQAIAEISVLNNVEEVLFGDEIPDLSKYTSLVIVAPTDSIPGHHLKALDNYLSGGGNLLIALNRVAGNFNTLQGNAVNTGLEQWLLEKGIVAEDRFIVDASCGTVGVVQQAGFIQYTTNIRFPYLPLINNFAKHPVTTGLSTVLLQFASPIRFTGDTAIVFEPIAFTSERSDARSVPLFFNIQHNWTERDFTQSKLPVAAVASGKFGGNIPARLVIIGDGDFAVAPDSRHNIHADNVNLLVNAIDWLSDKTGLVELRTKGARSRPLDEVNEGQRLFIKLLNFLLPIIIIISIGIYRWLRNRNIRMKRMEDVYV